MNKEQTKIIERHFPAGGIEIAKLRKTWENYYVRMDWDTHKLRIALDIEHNLLFN